MAKEQITPERAKQVVEALLFASDQPLQPQRLAQIAGKPHDTKAVREFIDALNQEYAAQNRAFEIVEIAGGVQMQTKPEFKTWVVEAHKQRRHEKLTPSAVETLAIIAYKQPILRVTIDDIRGVQTGPLLRNLQERGLIKAVGRQNVPGRPILYGTTRLFLLHFGLKSLKDLPQVSALNPPGAPAPQPPAAPPAPAPEPPEPPAEPPSEPSPEQPPDPQPAP